MNKILIYEDQHEKAELSGKYNNALAVLQKVVNAYNNIVFSNDAELTKEDFALLFISPSDVLFDKITGGDVSLGGISVDRTKAMEIIAKPEGYNEFVECFAEYKRQYSELPNRYNQAAFLLPASIGQMYVLNEVDRTVQLSDFSVKDIENTGKYYAKNPKAIAMFEFCTEMISLFKSKGLHTHFAHLKNEEAVLEVMLQTMQSVDWQNGSFMPNKGLSSL